MTMFLSGIEWAQPERQDLNKDLNCGVSDISVKTSLSVRMLWEIGSN